MKTNDLLKQVLKKLDELETLVQSMSDEAPPDLVAIDTKIDVIAGELKVKLGTE